MVKANSGAMGGKDSAEFMVETDAGEDLVAACERCGYAANTETANSRLAPADLDPIDDALPSKFATPGLTTIDALAKAEPSLAPASRQIKTLVYNVEGKLQLFLLRGDHDLNDVKLSSAAGTENFRPATREEILEALSAEPGSLGAVGVKELPIFSDLALEGRRGMVTGANETGFHLRDVDVARDLPARKVVDLRQVKAGEGCPNCEDGSLRTFKALEIGHIFKLGTRYSESMGATILDREGKQVPIVMGSYGIGVGRLMAAAVELHHDADGILWPASIAPFLVEILPLQQQDEAVREAAETLYRELQNAGIEVLLDDREERAGVKFKDADLLGLPARIAIGSRGLKNGEVELKLRGEKEPIFIKSDIESVLKALHEKIDF